MGCPVPKVANSGDGSGLMRNPELAVKVAEAVIRGAGGRPVTVKFRLGWDKGSINCVEFAQAMEAAGVAAVAVHVCSASGPASQGSSRWQRAQKSRSPEASSRPQNTHLGGKSRSSRTPTGPLMTAPRPESDRAPARRRGRTLG